MRLPSVTNLVGNDIEGINKWRPSVCGADDCIYGIPGSARRVVKFNPVDNSLTEIGPDLGEYGAKWYSGVLANNGCIYCIPCGFDESNQILKIDSINGTVTLLDVRLPETCPGSWISDALAIDGCIYFMPSNAKHILKLNPDNDSVASVGDSLGDVYGKYGGTVVGKDNCLYGIPNFKHIVRFNPVDQSISFVGEVARGFFNCIGNGALGRDGCIYALTHSGRRVLKIDVINNNYDSIVLEGLQSQYFGLISAILGNDGCIYWPPSVSNHALRPGRFNRALKFDPETKLASLVGDDFVGETPITFWRRGSAGPNGAIYCIPYCASRVLVIDPLKEFTLGLQANMEQYPEELGRLFKIDDNRHGKTTFECAVRKFGIEKVFEVIENCSIPSSVECSGSRIPSFMVAASFENSAVSIIYYLLRNNVDSSSLVNHNNNNFPCEEVSNKRKRG
jgi:hypothetical protein